jgi:hypothetical protein
MILGKKVSKLQRSRAQVAEHLPSKGEALSSNPSTVKKTNKRIRNLQRSDMNFSYVF